MKSAVYFCMYVCTYVYVHIIDGCGQMMNDDYKFNFIQRNFYNITICCIICYLINARNVEIDLYKLNVRMSVTPVTRYNEYLINKNG